MQQLENGGGVVGPGAVDRDHDRTCQLRTGRRGADDLARRIARPVRADNDANCFVLAESTVGAARGRGVVFGVTLGTG
ncbi:MAG TPA: ROK family protein, partial [Usitatibacteraceae bacterium]|nr:ROK family protein [Usitatibacteraceae bacterium]